MAERHWKKLTEPRAQELARKAGCEEAALDLIGDDATRTEALLERMIVERLWTDGVRLLAHALPVREAVWWGCLCVRSVYGEELDDGDAELLSAAERYVFKPTGVHGQEAFRQAQESPTQNAAQLLAMAAGFGSGKISMNENQPVPVSTDSCAPMVSGAVMIAATSVEPEEIPAMYERMLLSGIQIADGEDGRQAFAGDD